VIAALPKSGGTPRILVSGSQGVVFYSLTRDATNLYWIKSDSTSGTVQDSIQTMAIAGGPVSTLWTATEEVIDRIVVDTARVYFAGEAAGPPPLQGTRPGALRAMKKDGTGVVKLWSAPALDLLFSGQSLFWEADTDTSLYEMDLASSAVRRVGYLDGTLFAADARGAAMLGYACDPHPTGTPPARCRSWLRSMPSGNEIAFADDLAWAAAIDDLYAYWNPGGFELRRVRR
jgi:hypothetical protein